MSHQLTPDTTTMVTATLTGIIPGTANLFIDPDAPTGSLDWYVHVAAANLRDAAALLHTALQDAGRLTEDTSDQDTTRRPGTAAEDGDQL